MLAVANDKGKITILQIASLFKNDDGKTRLTLTVIILILYCYIKYNKYLQFIGFIDFSLLT